VPQSTGFGYGFGFAKKGEKFLQHSGHNPGWYAVFAISVDRRDGFVIASNSSRGGVLSDAVAKLWLKACRGVDVKRGQH
jgi:hypothetical protein